MPRNTDPGFDSCPECGGALTSTENRTEGKPNGFHTYSCPEGGPGDDEEDYAEGCGYYLDEEEEAQSALEAEAGNYCDECGKKFCVCPMDTIEEDGGGR